MNIIKAENVRRINSTTHGVEILSDYKYSEKFSTVVVLSEEDILNDNCLIKLRGYDISGLLIPKKYRYTFNDTSVGKLIQIQLNKKNIISYY